MSDYLAKADDLGRKLKKLYEDKIFLVGGVAAIVDPMRCLNQEWVDGVCTGEGELATLELFQNLKERKSIFKTNGFYFRRKRRIVKNILPPLVDVEELPFIDYSQGKLVDSGKILSIKDKDIKSFFGTTLWVSSSRGCPFHCAYCINSKLNPLRKKPRFHSTNYVLNEIQENLRHFPFFNCIYFNDESICARRKDEFHQFLKAYKGKINLPWSSYVDPFTLHLEDIDRMIESNCKKIKIGLQSGSSRINVQVFQRMDAIKKFPKILSRIKKYGNRLSLPIIDLIVDVPWVAKEDLIKEIRLLNNLPRPYSLEIFKLAYYPGTVIYDRAIKDGIIYSNKTKTQDHARGSITFYAGILLRIVSLVKIPNKLLNFSIENDWISSGRKMTFVSNLLHLFIDLRKLLSQIRAGDPTLLPFRIGKYLSPSYGQRRTSCHPYIIL